MTKFKKHETSIVESNEIGNGTSIWHHAHVRASAKIGEKCIIGKNAYIDTDVALGNGVKVQNNACIYSGTNIENNVFIGPAVVFTNDLRPRALIWNEERKGYTQVKKGASIGACSVIVCGTKEKPRVLGEYCMVGSGSVVTKDVPAHGLVYGNPAKLAGYVCTCGEKIIEKEVEKCKDGKCFHSLKK